MKVTVSTERTTDEAALIHKGTKFCGLDGDKKKTSGFCETSNIPETPKRKKEDQIMEEMRKFAPEEKKEVTGTAQRGGCTGGRCHLREDGEDRE